ncbi:MAG: hypothetical protein OXF26_10470 [Alphaproteobacteria bacterium]|nr:hypothetical protein [Alphaproteobacteria bacterium]MCY4319997.1 hypothetical protein [Alphaproteobacteria bacterium]
MAEDLTNEQRLERIEQAMVYFNRRQNDDIALSQEMRLDFLQEFKLLRKVILIMAAILAFVAIAMLIFLMGL